MKIIAIGEVLWDCFGDDRVMGGAPLNVAYHLTVLGRKANMISSIGNDDLGKEALDKISSLGISIDDIQLDQNLPTGKVNVTLNEKKSPSYEIVQPVAWDNIKKEEIQSINEPFALIFGTLAQRNENSRDAIRSLWGKAALKIYDVNLRPPFTTKEIVLDSLKNADVVKLNDDELITIGKWHDLEETDLKDIGMVLVEKYNLDVLLVTLGPNGAWCITEEGYFRCEGVKVEVADTVGAGDAFLASVINDYLNLEPWQDILEKANKLGAKVASLKGATPSKEELK